MLNSKITTLKKITEKKKILPPSNNKYDLVINNYFT